jgi:hypothetical protein
LRPPARHRQLQRHRLRPHAHRTDGRTSTTTDSSAAGLPASVTEAAPGAGLMTAAGPRRMVADGGAFPSALGKGHAVNPVAGAERRPAR